MAITERGRPVTARPSRSNQPTVGPAEGAGAGGGGADNVSVGGGGVDGGGRVDGGCGKVDGGCGGVDGGGTNIGNDHCRRIIGVDGMVSTARICRWPNRCQNLGHGNSPCQGSGRDGRLWAVDEQAAHHHVGGQKLSDAHPSLTELDNVSGNPRIAHSRGIQQALHRVEAAAVGIIAHQSVVTGQHLPVPRGISAQSRVHITGSRSADAVASTNQAALWNAKLQPVPHM